MFDLFLALFGGAYYSGKIGAEKRRKRFAEMERESKDKSYNEITSNYFVLKQDVETKYMNALIDLKTRNQALESIETELRQVYGNNWSNFFQRFNLPDPNCNGQKTSSNKECDLILHRPGNPWWAALTILIAKNEGKVLDCFADMTAHPFGKLEFVYNMNSSPEEREFPIKVMEIVEQYIKVDHPDYCILVDQEQKNGYIHIFTSWSFAPHKQ